MTLEKQTGSTYCHWWSIGTALLVSIGTDLYKDGPGSLFVAYVFYCCLTGCTNNCMAEIATHIPATGNIISSVWTASGLTKP